MSKGPPEGAFEALRTVVQVLEGHGYRYMLVGGLASFAWGEPRTTRDFDVAVQVDEDATQVGSRIRRVLASTGVDPQGPFSTDFGPRFVLPFPSVPFDVFLAAEAQATQFARRRRVAIRGIDLWIQSPEDLVLGKMNNAQRYLDDDRTDLRDAATVLFKQWREFDFTYAKGRARAEGLGAELEALVSEVRKARLQQGLAAD